MKKTTLLLLLLSLCGQLSAQNIGINANGVAPNASALLDIDASALPANAKRGLLIPRVALTATNSAVPIVAPATSLLVYNTATAGVVPNNVAPGFYQWDGLVWVPLLSGLTGWSTTGNNGITAANWLGTYNNADLIVRTQNIERMRILGVNGRVGVGTTTPTTTMEVGSGPTLDAIYGHSNNVGGYLGRETNITIGNPPQTLLGAGVYASNPAAGYTSTFAQSTGAATVAAAITYSDVWIAQYNYMQNNTAAVNPPGTYSQLNVTNVALGGDQNAYLGFSDRGVLAGNPGFTIGISTTANAQNQDAIGVNGTAFSNSLTRAGGYFESYNYTGTLASQAYAWVGTSVGGVARKITGTAAVSEIIPTPDHGRIMLTCPESPEYWYQDYGTVQLVNGHAHVDLDPILADIIMVNEQYPVRVFCTPVDMPDFNGVAQMNRTATGFDLVELNGGTHSGTLDYQLVVKPKTGYGEGRFPQAPGPAWLKKELEPAAARTANQPDPDRIFHWPSDHETYGYDVAKVLPAGRRVPAGPLAGKWKIADGVFSDQMPVAKPEERK